MSDRKEKVEHWADTAQSFEYNGVEIDIRPVLKKKTRLYALLPEFTGENINHGLGSTLFRLLTEKERNDAADVGFLQ